jgi:hypothetical protein
MYSGIAAKKNFFPPFASRLWICNTIGASFSLQDQLPWPPFGCLGIGGPAASYQQPRWIVAGNSAAEGHVDHHGKSVVQIA